MTVAPARVLRAGPHRLALGQRPLVMGILNATPDSFSDAGLYATLEARLERASQLLEAGADIIDVGGESAVTNRPAVSTTEEIERVVELIERVAGELGAIVSIDTYKAPVAKAAIAAGACIVNDTSGLRDPALADVCGESGAALVLMHTRAEPKRRQRDPSYDDVAADVEQFLRARIELARSHGVASEQLILDPGPDFAKTPAQTVTTLRALRRLHALGRPLLLALSRKDFVGAILGRSPRERLAGTLAAIGVTADAGAHIFRVHDVRETTDFLAVRAVLRGYDSLAAELRLSDELRWEPQRNEASDDQRLA